MSTITVRPLTLADYDGVRRVNERVQRHNEVVTYLLWDWFDGGFLSGWR